MTDIPADVRCTKDHLWARPDQGDGPVRVGVTDFARQSLGDVVDVPLPRLGETAQAGEPCGDIESTKSVNDLIAPVTGTIAARNDELAAAPDLVNTDPYGQGWMFEIDADRPTLGQQLATLMDAAAYRQLAGGRGMTATEAAALPRINHRDTIDGYCASRSACGVSTYRVRAGGGPRA
jgi:glycine cleavage system H protein